ncbi:and other transporter-domain-containing protein [Naematelia encephala]|uniref:And other transporter-domain-containing protein n=1 Tax=Naematelia encephala TaxID=71784 RepID=A0A1Y2AMZ0_9TREE|nr:and other transporter-domain-containing protein [Naematelia encephala]
MSKYEETFLEETDDKHVRQSVLENGRDADLVANINSNVSAKIQNPLFGIPKEQLFADVDSFCQAEGFTEHTELFRKGALLAQNPGRFEGYSELDEVDKTVIRREKTHKWAQPRALIFTVVLASIGAAVQGWDQTGSNGANLSFPIEFNINDASTDPNHARNQWIVGVVNAAPYIASALLGCWLNDPVNNLLGRRGTIFVAAVFCLLSPIGSAFTQNWKQLFITRLLLGVGMGLKGSTVPIFNSENVPASVRGGLVMSWQLWTAFGIFLGFCANLAVYKVGKLAWRLQLGSAFLPALPLVLLIFLCPESPRWLMKKHRYQDAFASLIRLRNSPLQAARDLYYVHRQLEEEYAAVGRSNVFSRFVQLFTIPRVRRATLASFVVMLAQQMCGINIIAFYSSTVFQDAGYGPLQCLLASWGFGLLNFTFAIPAVFTIDTFGRRNLLLSTFPLMAVFLLATGLTFLMDVGNSARVPLIAVFIYLFAIAYSVGEGPVPFAYSAEVFPITHREVGMGWAVATCLFWAAVLSLTFPRMKGALGPTGAFGFYAGLNVVALVMIFFLLPETKQLTLEELDYVFGVPTSKHAGYQLHTWLPWFIKRHVFRNKNARLEPLYHLEEVGGVEKDPEYTAQAVGAMH